MPYQPLSSLSGLYGTAQPRDTRLSFPQSDIPDATGSKINLSKMPAYSISPMGAPAASPEHNVTPKPNTIAQNKVKPPTAPSQTNPPPTPMPQQPQAPMQTQQGASAISSFPGLVGAAANAASGAVSGTNTGVQNANNNLLNFQKGYSESVANNADTPIPIQFQQGRAQIMQNQYSQQLPAYQTAVQNQITSQGQGISGLNTAAGLASPQSIPLTSQPYYPVEGQFSGAGGGVGQRATQAANISSLGGLVDKSNNYHANFGGIQNLQDQLTNFLGVKALNPTTFPYVNQAISSILTRGVGDPNYQQLNNYMSDLASRYASYFGNDAAPTNQVRNVANSLINGNAKPADIAQVLQGLSTQAGGVMQGIDTQIQNIQNNPSGLNGQQGAQQSGGGGLYDW